MGFLAAIGGFISTAVSVVGSTIATVADVLVNKLPLAIEVAKVVLNTISTVISKVCEILEIAPPNENVDELGAKTIQEGTRAKMEGETTQEYLDYLRNDVQLDQDKYAKLSEEEKLACKAIGTSMLTKSIEEKTGVELPPEFLLTIAKAKLNYNQVERLIDVFSRNDLTSMGEFVKYITNDIADESHAQKVGLSVKETIKELQPELSDADIQKEIGEMKVEYSKES